MIPETMKAAVYLGTDHIEVREMPVPEIDDDGALVKVHACAVCGSDLRTFHYGNKRVKPGTIMGHEISGETVAVGKMGDLPHGRFRQFRASLRAAGMRDP